MSFFLKYRRTTAFCILGAATCFGVWQLFRGDDWREALDFWSGRWGVLGLALCLQAVDVLLDGILWLWVLDSLGIRPGLRRGLSIFLAGFAGILMPAQLGRLLRPEEIARLGMGRFGDAVRAEVLLLAMSGTAAAAVMAGALVHWLHPWLALPVTAVVVFGMFGVANLVFDRVYPLRVLLPEGYLRRPRVVVMAFMAVPGWLLNSVCLHLLVRDNMPGATVWQALFVAPSNMIVGAVSGLPGGIGAVETYLGAALRVLEMPGAHLALAVASFRLVTFWLWLPLGWLAFIIVSRWNAPGFGGKEDGTA